MRYLPLLLCFLCVPAWAGQMANKGAANVSTATGILPMANGGFNANLTASNGGILYSGASAIAVLAGTSTANQALLSGSSTTPAWSTATYPATTTVNQILYSSAANVIGGLGTANNSVLVTSGAGVPSLAAAGTGLVVSSSSLSSAAVYQIAFQPGLITAVTNTKGVYGKISKAATVDNIEGAAITFTCAGNPTITFYECGTSATCASPTTIGSVTVTAGGQVFDGTVNNAAITAGDYVAWAISAGTCTALDISATAQAHSN
jgi:hypothetical protein